MDPSSNHSPLHDAEPVGPQAIDLGRVQDLMKRRAHLLLKDDDDGLVLEFFAYKQHLFVRIGPSLHRLELGRSTLFTELQVEWAHHGRLILHLEAPFSLEKWDALTTQQDAALLERGVAQYLAKDWPLTPLPSHEPVSPYPHLPLQLGLFSAGVVGALVVKHWSQEIANAVLQLLGPI